MLQMGNVRARAPQVSAQENEVMGSIYEELVDIGGHPNRSGKIDVVNTALSTITSEQVPQLRQYLRLIKTLLDHHLSRDF